MQIMRIQEHPFHICQTGENASGYFIVNDNLETGSIQVYENLGNIVNIQQLAADIGRPANAVLLAEITIGALWQNEGVFIHGINCEYGHEFLVKSMLEQVIHFAAFYKDFKSVRLSEREWEKWFMDAHGILADFYKKGRTYIYQVR